MRKIKRTLITIDILLNNNIIIINNYIKNFI